MPDVNEVDELLAAFYGRRRDWSIAERSAANTLIQHHGWSAARAAFVAEWLEGDPNGRFWRAALSDKDGICTVLRSIAKILEASGANAHVGHRQGWQAYGEYADPAGAEPKEIAERTFAQKVAAVEEPWKDLIEEAHALGLTGPAMSRWVFAERARRTGQPPIETGFQRMATQTDPAKLQRALEYGKRGNAGDDRARKHEARGEEVDE